MLNQVVTFPYFKELQGVGAGGQYHIAGYGAFYVTGYFLGGQYKAGGPPYPCNGAVRCVAGYFVPLTTTTGDPGGDDRGVVLITFSG